LETKCFDFKVVLCTLKNGGGRLDMGRPKYKYEQRDGVVVGQASVLA